MRAVSTATEAAWKATLRGGNARPTVRATIELGRVRQTPYSTANAPGGDYDHARPRKGRFRNIVFGAMAIREVRNIRRCDWSRSVDQDIAECTLTVLNAEVTPIGVDSGTTDFEQAGLFTYNRGDETIGVNRWGYDDETGWNSVMVPDRVVRTYEGYGIDEAAHPYDDVNLYQSGTWLIDSVKYDATGDIVIQMRDLARLLVDHIAFKPIVPHDDYPLHWSKIDSIQVPSRDVNGGAWGRPGATCSSSNVKYIGTDLEPRYVNDRGGVFGRNAQHAYSEGDDTYWLSTGQTSYDDVVFWEAKFKQQQTLGAVRIMTKAGPYKVYVSVETENGWRGRKTIPYEVTTGGINLSAGVRFVTSFLSTKANQEEIILPKKYRNVKRVRLTFTRLRRFTGAQKYPWRAALGAVSFYTGEGVGFGKGNVLKPVGNYQDYTDIIKWMGAWSGFWWPDRNDNFILSGGVKNEYTYPASDPVLPRGRVWGSFQNTGTNGVADLTPDQFDKQPLLDVINYVREVTGFSFWVDECGGMVWRLPNLFELGNYLSPHHTDDRRRPDRTDEIVTIDENETLRTYSTTLNSRNIRERVFVANSSGKFGTAVRGFNPYPTGLVRVAGWTDQHWKNARECRVAADMIVARQMFDYRRAQMTIPANPAIQIDDQVRIYERVTNETYYHYVLGVSSSLDMDEGTWDYSLETHWLGEDPNDAWAVKVDQLDLITQSYLQTIGDVD